MVILRDFFIRCLFLPKGCPYQDKINFTVPHEMIHAAGIKNTTESELLKGQKGSKK
jgi:hypothetical protein